MDFAARRCCVKIKDVFHEMKERFREAIGRNQSKGILLSGGLDSSLAAAYVKDGKAISFTIIVYTRRW